MLPTNPGLPVPTDIFRAAAHNNIVSSYVKLWSNGMVTWEQALMCMVLDMQAAYNSVEAKLLEQLNVPKTNTGH